MGESRADVSRGSRAVPGGDDSGQADSFLYYVMPYVEGESLRDRINRDKQLPVDETVALARKVAGALQHAHDHGAIHRDRRFRPAIGCAHARPGEESSPMRHLSKRAVDSFSAVTGS